MNQGKNDSMLVVLFWTPVSLPDNVIMLVTLGVFERLIFHQVELFLKIMILNIFTGTLDKLILPSFNSNGAFKLVNNFQCCWLTHTQSFKSEKYDVLIQNSSLPIDKTKSFKKGGEGGGKFLSSIDRATWLPHLIVFWPSFCNSVQNTNCLQCPTPCTNLL